MRGVDDATVALISSSSFLTGAVRLSPSGVGIILRPICARISSPKYSQIQIEVAEVHGFGRYPAFSGNRGESAGSSRSRAL